MCEALPPTLKEKWVRQIIIHRQKNKHIMVALHSRRYRDGADINYDIYDVHLFEASIFLSVCIYTSRRAFKVQDKCLSRLVA